MTKAEIIPLNDGMLFTCSGHAGYAEKGKDIVCAGISALCMALLSSLRELHDEDIIKIRRIYTADGFVTAEIGYPDDFYSRQKAEAVFMTVLNGLKEIEKLYPDNLIVNQLLTV